MQTGEGHDFWVMYFYLCMLILFSPSAMFSQFFEFCLLSTSTRHLLVTSLIYVSPLSEVHRGDSDLCGLFDITCFISVVKIK